jgi:hypothetical protein
VGVERGVNRLPLDCLGTAVRTGVDNNASPVAEVTFWCNRPGTAENLVGGLVFFSPPDSKALAVPSKVKGDIRPLDVLFLPSAPGVATEFPNSNQECLGALGVPCGEYPYSVAPPALGGKGARSSSILREAGKRDDPRGAGLMNGVQTSESASRPRGDINEPPSPSTLSNIQLDFFATFEFWANPNQVGEGGGRETGEGKWKRRWKGRWRRRRIVCHRYVKKVKGSGSIPQSTLTITTSTSTSTFQQQAHVRYQLGDPTRGGVAAGVAPFGVKITLCSQLSHHCVVATKRWWKQPARSRPVQGPVLEPQPPSPPFRTPSMHMHTAPCNPRQSVIVTLKAAIK